MLILQRKAGQSLRIGENITVTIVAVENNRVRIAIDAPTDISILRSELIEAIAANRRDRTGDDRFDPVYTVMLEREARVLEMLAAEGIVER